MTLPTKLLVDYSDGQYYTRPIEPDDDLDALLKWATIIELTPDQAARYDAYLSESTYWQNEFRKADNKAYEIRHNAGLKSEEI